MSLFIFIVHIICTLLSFNLSIKANTNNFVHMLNMITYHLHRPVANLTCFKKSAYYSGIKIFNNLPSSLKCLMNEKAQFKVALKRYLNTHSFYSVDEFLCT
jgi:hypothetical protein